MQRLTRIEIDLLKYLAKFSPTGIPIVVPSRFQAAFAGLWRAGLIEIWYRQRPAEVGTQHVRFVSITIEGGRRIDAILSAQPER